MKTFEVLVTGYRTLIVKAESEEDAHKQICEFNPHLGFDWEVDEYKVEQELSPFQEERAIKHGAVRMEEL